MLRKIKVGNKEISCCANALTPLAYTELFKKDFLKTMVSFRSFKGKDMEKLTDDELSSVTRRTNAFSEMLFIMNRQAELKEASKIMSLSKDDYYEWLTGFEQGDINPDVMIEIIALWRGQSDGEVESKNA